MIVTVTVTVAVTAIVAVTVTAIVIDTCCDVGSIRAFDGSTWHFNSEWREKS